MRILKKILGQRDVGSNAERQDDDPVIPVPIPPLFAILAHLESEKGAPLTENEVWQARDKAICMTMRASMRDQLAQKRGYADVDMENAWSDWQVVRQTIDLGDES